MLLIVIRLLEAGLEMGLQGQRAVLRSSERIGAECQVSVYLEIVHSEACEVVLSERIPLEVLVILSVGSCVEVNRILEYIAAAFKVVCRLEAVVACQLVSKSDIDLGNDRIRAPWLEAQEHAVVKSHDSERIGARDRIQIETVVVEVSSEVVVYDVMVAFAEDRVFAAVSDECRRDIFVYSGSECVGCQCEAVGRCSGYAVRLELLVECGDRKRVSGSHYAVADHSHLLLFLLFLYLADEVEWNPVFLIEEYSVPLDVGAGIFQVNVDFSCIYKSVPDLVWVCETSVVALVDPVVYEAGVHLVLLSKIVGGYDSRSVVGVFPSEHSSASESMIFKRKVECRSYVLGRQDLDVGLFLLLCGEQGSPVGELCMRRLGIVLRKSFRRVCVRRVG